MASFLDRWGRAFFQRVAAKPTVEQGVPGFRIYGGYLQPDETNANLYGLQRWRKASEILANMSVVAASLRFMMNLISRPAWSFEPADESSAAKKEAEFMQSIIDDMDTSWTRVIRRAGMYKYHGFAAYEWISKNRDDGRIGIQTIEPRPQHTIEKWDVDDAGLIVGLIQRDPQTSKELYLPRTKLLYLVDDTLTDRPDGLGWFRHLVEPADRLKSLLQLETQGFERDLRGLPVGRAPMGELNRLVKEGKLTEQQRDAMLGGLRDFVELQRKTTNTGLVLDSETYVGKTETGQSPSQTPLWDISLITGEPGALEEMGDAVRRLQFDMALIIGTEVMLTGREGEGSRALSEDKSRNLYLSANAIMADIAEAVDRDIRDRVWEMNGLDDKLKPKATFEDVSFKDAAEIAQVLNDMASAGAILAPDDPAINDLRDLLGIPHAEPMDLAMLNALQGKPDPTKPSPEAELADERAREQMDREDQRAKEQGAQKPGSPTKKAIRLSGFNPDQPRAPKGSEDGGQWVSVSGDMAVNPLDPGEVLTDDPFAGGDQPIGGLRVRDTGDGWHLTEVRSITRGGGRRAMEQLTDLADQHGKSISLFAVPLDSPAGLKMSPTKLRGWYESFGFVRQGKTDHMVRQPFGVRKGGGPTGRGPFNPVTRQWRTAKFNPNQPRVPAGRAGGGRWTDGNGTEVVVDDELREKLDKADQELEGDAARAVDEFVGHEPLSRDKQDMDAMGFMSARRLEDGLAEGAPWVNEIEEKFAPIREEMRSRFGDEVVLHRVQRPVNSRDPNVMYMSEGTDPNRQALSWTADREFAEFYAVGPRLQNLKPPIAESTIGALEAEYASAGSAKIPGTSYEIRREFYDLPFDADNNVVPGWSETPVARWEKRSMDMIYRGSEQITDTDGVRDFVNRTINEGRLERIAERDAGLKRIVTRTVPLDDVLWVTDRAGQAEFIVRNRGAAHISRASVETQKGFDPNQPRDPAGTDTGGQWTDGHGGQMTIPKKFRPRSFAELKAHPAVASIDDYRPDGMHINLAEDFYWSEQRSFGVETVGEALRLFGGVYWQGEGRPPWEEAEKRFNPDQPRHPRGHPQGGQWADTGGGEARPLSPEEKDRLVEELNGKTIEEMVEMGQVNQEELRAIGRPLEQELGLTFVDPGPKSAARVQEKLFNEGYEGPHQITDYSRATFVVDSPEDADRVIDALSRNSIVYDKGWKLLDEYSYVDRKLFVQHENGGLSEVQLVPRPIAIYKGGPGMPRSRSVLSGMGHRLYEISRSPRTPRHLVERANALQRRLYGRAVAGTAFMTVVAGYLPPGGGN